MSGMTERLKQRRIERRVRRRDAAVHHALDGVEPGRSYKEEMLAEMFRYGRGGGTL